MKTVGEILKEERIKRKMTLRDMAEIGECSHGFIKRIEDGNARDNKFVTSVDKLCRFVKMPREKRLKMLEMCCIG